MINVRASLLTGPRQRRDSARSVATADDAIHRMRRTSFRTEPDPRPGSHPQHGSPRAVAIWDPPVQLASAGEYDENDARRLALPTLTFPLTLLLDFRTSGAPRASAVTHRASFLDCDCWHRLWRPRTAVIL